MGFLTNIQKLKVTAGAEFITLDLPSHFSESDIKKAVAREIEDDKHENGHGGYSGTWAEVDGVKVTSKIFDSYKEAEEYLLANAQKWEDALAVRYKKNSLKDEDSSKKYKEAISSDKKLAKAKEQVKAIKEKITSTKNTVSTKILEKGTHIACQKCTSKIAKEYVRKNYDGLLTCPVCNTAMIKDTHSSSIKNMQEDLKAKEQVIKEIELSLLKKHAKEDTPWLVGAWASS